MLPSHLSADTNRCWDFFFFCFALLWSILPFTTAVRFVRRRKKEKLLEGFKFSYLQKAFLELLPNLAGLQSAFVYG